MSHLDSTPAPDAAEPTGHAKERSGSSRTPAFVIGLVLVLLVGVLGYLFLGSGDGDPEAADCISDTVTLTTAPVMKDLVEQAVDKVNSDEPCIDIEVTAGTVKDVVAMLGDPNAKMPELWVPDSPTWKGQLAAAGWSGVEVAEVLAQTPVGLVSGPSAEAPASWTAALNGGRLAMSDPSAEGASALALLAPLGERKQTKATPDQIKQMTVPVAQTYGERAVSGGSTTTDLATITATSTQLVPATEHDYLAARRGNDQLALVAPATGVPMLQFPLVDVNRGSDVLGTRSDLSARVGRAIARWFASGAGVEAVAAAELRGADAEPLSEGIGLGAAKVLAKPDQKVTDSTLRDWRVLSIPSSIINVFDLSGSMKTAIGDTTRINLAVNSSLVGLDALPDHARVGTWGFSKNRGGEGQSWQEFTPLLRLDAEAEDGEGLSQREFLVTDAASVPGRVRGATGIMDTVLAAYKRAQEQYDPAYFNSVVFWTDGAADDSSDLSLESLVSQLKSISDPARPVKVIIFGISEDADTPELAQIAAATGGQNYLVLDPDDMLGTLAQALLNR